MLGGSAMNRDMDREWVLTNGGVLDKLTCQAILGVAHAGSIPNLPLLDKELFCGKVFNLV
jgi:hypothetical protein